MTISVYGNTHYAWVTAAKLAEKGNRVALFGHEQQDDSGFAVEREWMLPELIAEQRAAGRLQLDNAWQAQGDIFLLASDFTEASLLEWLQAVAGKRSSDAVVLVLSPLPVGSLARVQQKVDAFLQQSQKNFAIFLAALPLFIREGTALADFERPQLFLLGSEEPKVLEAVKVLMRPFMRQAREVMVVPITTAELVRFGINAMLATRISFMNEMAALSERFGVDIDLVRQGMAADSRVGGAYLQAGCGFGGPSFSGDLLSLARTIKEELDTEGLIESVLAINESQKEILFRKIWRFFRGDLAGKTVAVWGAAFKPGTPSVSNSVIHTLLPALWAQGCRTRVYDPQANEALRAVYPKEPLLALVESAAAAAEGADCLALVTAWDEFWSPDFAALAQRMKQAVMFDGRNLYDPEQMRAYGFRYFGIGRGESV